MNALGASMAVLALGATIATACVGPTAGAPSEEPDSTGEQTAVVYAPDFRITAYQGSGVLGGEEVWLSSLFSREPGVKNPIVLNFWTGQCPPCRAEMPDLQEVHEEYGDRVLLLGLDVGPFVYLGSREDGQALLRELQVTYAAGTTFDGEVIREFELVGMPTTYFIKSDGGVHRTWTGLLTKDKTVELVEELLSESS